MVVESLWVMSISEQPWRKEKAHGCYGAVVITFEMQKASSAPTGTLNSVCYYGRGKRGAKPGSDGLVPLSEHRT